MVRIERLEPSAWERLRAIRLHALLGEPDAFGSTNEREAAYDETQWRELVALGPWWVAVDGDARDVGLVAVGHRRADGHVWVYSMWVDEAWRGRAVATALLDVVVAWAHAEGEPSIGLDVADRVPRARRFYERYGFRANGVTFAMPRETTITLTEMTLEIEGVSPTP